MTVDILICTLDEGILDVDKVLLPEKPNIKYIISWQQTKDFSDEFPQALKRDDVQIIPLEGKGLSRNRNNAIKYATSDICMIADDDVVYDYNGITAICDYYNEHPEVDVVTYKFSSNKNQKKHPDYSFDLRKTPKGYSISSIEISFRRAKVQGRISFNELMGLGSPYSGSGEDNLFILDCLNLNLKCQYIPINVLFHEHESTGRSQGGASKVVFSRGIMTRIFHPHSYMLKYLWLARSIKINHQVGFWATLRQLFRGGRYAKKNGMLKYDIKEIYKKEYLQ